MSHQKQRNYIQRLKNRFQSNFNNVKVLEVGSLNINGTVRDFFENCDYLGIDVGKGKGVDLVVGGHEHTAPDNTYDTVISCECFEHNPYWLETFINMHRMCKVGGLVIMTCATTGRPEHGTTRTSPRASPLTLDWDYYMNLTEEDFTSKLNISDLFNDFKFTAPPRGSKDLQFFGIKK